MNGELMPLVNGSTPVTRNDRPAAGRAKQVYDDTRLAAFAADGAFALAGHIMEGAKALDAHRRALAGDDPLLNAELADFEAEAFQQAKGYQRDAYNHWRL